MWYWLVDTYPGDIRAAPMLLLRMFETPHRTVAWFRKEHQSGAKKKYEAIFQSAIDRVPVRRIAFGAYLSRNRYLAGFADRPKEFWKVDSSTLQSWRLCSDQLIHGPSYAARPPISPA